MDVASGIGSVVDATKAWVKQPFTSQMDLFHWFLIVGVVIVASVFWSMILSNFRE